MLDSEAWIGALGFFSFLHTVHHEAQTTGLWQPTVGLWILPVG